MDAHERMQFDLTRLAAELEEVLNNSVRTKRKVFASYEDAKKLAGKWQVPDSFALEELLECTCNVDVEDSSLNEVAKGIEHVVEEAQKIREKISSNANPQSKKLLGTQKSNKESDLKKAGTVSSNTSSIIKKCINKLSKEPGDKSGCNSRPMTNSNLVKPESKLSLSKKLESRLPRTLSASRKSLSPNSLANGAYDKRPTSRPFSKSTSSLKTTYQKDFSICPVNKIAKLSRSHTTTGLKAIESSNNNALVPKNVSSPISKEMENKNKNMSFISSSGKISITELEEILCRVAIYPNINLDAYDQKTAPKITVPSCKLHGEKVDVVSKKGFRTVGLIEAIDVLGVPPELVKVLKVYHSFLTSQSSSITNKGQSSASSFASKLSKLNDCRRNSLAYEPLVGTFLEYLSLIVEGSKYESDPQNATVEKLSDLQEKSEELDIKFRKWCNVDESVLPKLHTRNKELAGENTLALLEGWDVLGVWYTKSTGKFRALQELRFIRYSSEKDWKKFAANLQKIQQMAFQLEIFDILEKDIFPQLLGCNPQDPVFNALFKAASILSNISKLRSPLLIKTV